MSAWIEHIKDYAKQKEMKYTEAMKDPQCKELYHKNKSPVDKKKVDEMTRPKVSIQMEKVDKPKTSKAKKDEKEREKITHEEMNAPMISMNTIDKVLKLKPPKKEGSKKKT
jgi:hypothetical protein